MNSNSTVLQQLMQIIEQRRGEKSEKSYTAKLLAGGVPAIAAKIREEATEVIEAADEPGDAGREHFHFPGREAPVMLEPRDPVLYYVQRLRDEAHRFAIGTHRAKRAKSIGANPLDEIGGIGPTRKSALMKHFGSAKAVSRASVEDLKQVAGISGDMARRIYDHFHENG